jgi:tRNA pseudouridine13 synthase
MLRIKQRSEDFRVRELLREGVLSEQGEWRVYRVVKRKLTSIEAAARLAELAGASAGDVSMAGLKDRQGVTVQHMALRRGRAITSRGDDLRIESVGFAHDELTPQASEGNAFEIVVRGLERDELDAMRANMPVVREQGVINYFDDQRFGNLRHNQGWIALYLMRGEHERALKALLAGRSPHDDRHAATFKSALTEAWGDWRACRDVAGRFRAHHSIFEHLKRSPEDFAGAFEHVATRLRLIHLFAFQSHIWNRAVAEYVREQTTPQTRLVADSVEGPLVFPAGLPRPGAALAATFRLPGPRLEDVQDAGQRALLADALAAERLVPAQFDIQGVPGFQLKGEDRALAMIPRHLRIRPSEPDKLNPGTRLVKLRFELPRGAYATLVIKRLLARPIEGGEGSAAAPPAGAAHSESGEVVEDRDAWLAGPGTPSRDRRPSERGPQTRHEGERRQPWTERRGPPRGEWRGPPRDDRRGPPRDDRRGPPRDDRRGPPRDDRGGPQRGEWRGPPRGEWRGPPRDDRRSPPQGEWRGPPRDDRRGPPRDDRRGPPRDDRRGPPRNEGRGPFREDRHGPRGDSWRAPREDRRQPQRDDRGGRPGRGPGRR